MTTIRTKQLLLLLLEHLEHNPSYTLPRLVVLRSLGDKGMFSESILVGTDIGMPIKVPIGLLCLYVKHYIARLIRRKQLSWLICGKMPARQLIMMLLLLTMKKCASVRNHHQQTRTAVLFFFAPRLLSSLFGVQHNYLILDHPPPHTLLCSCTSVVVGGIMGETPSAPALLLNYNIALLVYK